MDNSVFDSEGIVVFGYTLFALGLATRRRRLAACSSGESSLASPAISPRALFVDAWLRQRLLTPLTATWRVDRGTPASLAHAWGAREYPSDRHGHAVSILCPGVHGSHPELAIPKCLARHTAGYLHAVYQPASHFWPLQGIETALFGGVRARPDRVRAWWTHERAA